MMNFVKHMKSDKQFRASVLTLFLALCALISGLFALLQVYAWFINVREAEADLVLSDFDTKIEYRISDKTWKELPAGNALPVIMRDGNTILDVSRLEGISSVPDKIELQISYTGISHAYIRASLHGSFRNADTKTYLPQMDGLWRFSGNNWDESGHYWYYKHKAGDIRDPEKTFEQYKDAHVLSDTLTVTVDLSKLSDTISQHQDYEGELFIFVDAVQPDRYTAFWELSKLPFDTQ